MDITNLLRFVLHWTGFGEEGTIGLYLAGATAKDQTTLQTMLDHVDTALGSAETPPFYNNFAGILVPGQRIDEIALYQYAAGTGKASVVASKSLSGHAGTSAAMYGPLQCALVVTTLTGAAGRSNRGRMYFPAHTLQPQAGNALLLNGKADLIGQMAGQLIGDVRDSLRATPGDDGIRPVVFSRTNHSAREITSIKADNKVDTQRRREASLAPNYSYTAAVNVP